MAPWYLRRSPDDADADGRTVALRVGSPTHQAHEYWYLSGLTADLVILATGDEGLLADIRRLAAESVGTGASARGLDRPGGIFVRHASELPQADRVLLLAVARVVLNGDGGPLAQQLELCRAPPTIRRPAPAARCSDDEIARTNAARPGPLEEGCCSATASVASRPTGVNT